MPIQDLLAQVGAEHETLQSKYDEALADISFLRTRLANLQAPDSVIKSLGKDDGEATPPKQQVLLEPLCSAFPPEPYEAADRAVTSLGVDTEVAPLHQHLFLEPFHGAPLPDLEKKHTDEFLRVGGRASMSMAERGLKPNRVVWFLRNPAVEMFLVAMVLSNIGFMWFETDRRAAKMSKTVWWDIVDTFYLAFYICEFLLRVAAYRQFVFADRWTRLDFAVIVADLVSLVFDAIWGDGLFGGFNASIFRVLRVFRLIRLFKIFRFAIELQLLIHGFFGAVKAVLFAAVMLEMVVLLWSFIYVEVIHPYVVDMSNDGYFHDCNRCVVAYSSIWQAHMTIWQQVIASDSWGVITLDVLSEHPLTVLVFAPCLMTIQFAMLNLIFTVIVDAASRAREEDEQQKLVEKEMAFQHMKDKIIKICKHLDKDGGGELTLDELLAGYDNDQTFADTMLNMDITPEDMSTLFMIMDEDRSGSVSYMEFVNNMYKMKEQDVHTMLMFVKGYVVDLRIKMKEDVTIMLKESLNHSVQSSRHIESVMTHVESLVADNKAGVGRSSLLAQQANPAPDMSAFEQNVKKFIEQNMVDILQAIHQLTNVVSCSNQGFCSTKPTVLTPSKLLSVPPSAMSR